VSDLTFSPQIPSKAAWQQRRKVTKKVGDGEEYSGGECPYRLVGFVVLQVVLVPHDVLALRGVAPPVAVHVHSARRFLVNLLMRHPEKTCASVVVVNGREREELTLCECTRRCCCLRC
jgi:hypothetical protein